MTYKTVMTVPPQIPVGVLGDPHPSLKTVFKKEEPSL